MSKYTFILALVILTILAGTLWLAVNGSLIAVVALAMLITVSLVLTGAMIALATQRMANEKAQADFVANAKENLMLLQQQQKLQNMQNSTIMEQLRTAARLPETTNTNGFIIEGTGIFDELD